MLIDQNNQLKLLKVIYQFLNKNQTALLLKFVVVPTNERDAKLLLLG